MTKDGEKKKGSLWLYFEEMYHVVGTPVLHRTLSDKLQLNSEQEVKE